MFKANNWFKKFSLAAIVLGLNTLPINSAEKIYFVYTPLKLSLKVDSLAAFAQDGTINDDLKFYLNKIGATEEQKAKFQKALVTPIEVNPVILARLLNTDMGERLLDNFGTILNIEGGGNGKYLIRGAMIQAAFEPEGLTILSFLEKLSTDIEFDLEKLITLSKYLKIVVQTGYQYTDFIAELSAQEAAKAPKVDFSELLDYNQLGPLKFQKTTWNLTDKSRDRSFYVNVYQPENWRGELVPVAIISHGLSSRPEDFDWVASQLASYGYFVVAPQHPGSDKLQSEALKQGYSREFFRLNEFIDRPLDISYVIDELERRNFTEFDNRLDLKNIGVLGHSFGGYTALAVAGATIDFNYLEKDCTILQSLEMFNTSLLLQCRALKLPRQEYNFRDERVQAIFIFNPVMSAIFGYEGLAKINIPTFIGAGSYDPATPFVYEQARGFRYLQTSQRYLLLEEGQAHVDFSNIDGGINKLHHTLPRLTLPSPELLHHYTKSLMLPFLEVYVSNQPEYQVYLQSSYLDYLSQDQTFKAFLITTDSSEAFNEKVNNFLREILAEQLEEFPDLQHKLR